MDTCVRNGYYEEALELTDYVRRLGKKHSNIPIIMNIVSDVQNSNRLMLNQLVNQLRSNVQLPTCLKVIGYLRRMDVFSEAELRIKFLQSRDIWFQNILSTIPNDDVSHHLTKTIEVSRVHLFDIITQYRAIFSDDDPLLSTGRDNPDINESAIFHGWILHKIKQFIATLQQDLKRGESQGILGRLDSILGQAMYFGLSFSRIGADFRGLIAPVFENVAIRGFANCTRLAASKFADAMDSFSLTSLPCVVSTSLYSVISMERLTPSNRLLEFHPLARFCNNILNGFNELRLCCPMSAAQIVSQELQNSCSSVTKYILKFHKAEETALTENEIKSFNRMCSVFAEELVPYLDTCLQSLFPPAQLAETLGCSLSQVHSMRMIGSLEKSEIVADLQQFLQSDEDSGITFAAEDDIIKINSENVDIPPTETKPSEPKEHSEQTLEPASEPALEPKNSKKETPEHVPENHKDNEESNQNNQEEEAGGM
ncbi:Conserved oligomeric Golgi complex subunit 8 [Nymphon striatum]|nr:Conserved oligomeric Golgi complex subunit 8 [Nymphon striatum]